MTPEIRAAVLERLKADIRAAGGQRPWARAHGIAPAYVWHVASGRRPPSPRILAELGLGLTMTLGPTQGPKTQAKIAEPETPPATPGDQHQR